MRDPVVLCSLITNKDKSFLDIDHQILGCAIKNLTKVQPVQCATETRFWYLELQGPLNTTYYP